MGRNIYEWIEGERSKKIRVRKAERKEEQIGKNINRWIEIKM